MTTKVFTGDLARFAINERDRKQFVALQGGVKGEPAQAAADAAGWLYDRYSAGNSVEVDLDDVIEYLEVGMDDCSQVYSDSPISHYAGILSDALEELISDLKEAFPEKGERD